jgi:hypothetical protein
VPKKTRWCHDRKQTPGPTAYTVTVNGVLDTSKKPGPHGFQATFYSYIILTNGIMKFSYWGGINRHSHTNLLDDPRYPALRISYSRQPPSTVGSFPE